MATRDITAEEFEALITENDMVLVDFWADWCGPCKRFSPVFEASSEKHPDIVYAKVDTETAPELVSSAGIVSIPTLMAFREGVLVFNQAGALPAAGLEQVVESVRNLDMDEVRKQISEEDDD
jgi:thioredoxin 1